MLLLKAFADNAKAC